jgi:hypothetical protein
MPSNALGNSPRPKPACTACPEGSRRERSECALSPSTALRINSAEGPALPALSGVEGRETKGRFPKGSLACPFPHESPILTRSPLLIANRGYAELEIVLSPCKQRTTALSNRGGMRVVQPLRHRSRTTHPALPKLNANRNTNLLAIALTRWKQRVTTLPNRHKIHSCTERSERVQNAPFLDPIPRLVRR